MTYGTMILELLLKMYFHLSLKSVSSRLLYFAHKSFAHIISYFATKIIVSDGQKSVQFGQATKRHTTESVFWKWTGVHFGNH